MDDESEEFAEGEEEEEEGKNVDVVSLGESLHNKSNFSKAAQLPSELDSQETIHHVLSQVLHQIKVLTQTMGILEVSL